jgi:serine/threonine protein kinase
MGSPDVARVTHEPVRIPVLTPYQAAALRQGKGKGLFVGSYEVLDGIGTGGMGKVFKAVHREFRAIVALKVLPPSFARRKPAVVERFRREAEALAGLRHPNIVRCLEPVKEVDGVYYLVMEYVEGRDLGFLVEKRGVFTVEQAIACLLQAAKGLQFAHSSQIIHRDIKPANLILDRTNKVRILDFGLARVVKPDWLVHEEGDGTSTGAILGTIAYMAPEQALDSKRANARSDIYSLGCTLHFLLTGRPPYTGNTWAEMFLAHRESPIPSLKAARPTVPDHLEDLFKRMLAKDPADRPPTMASVIASIELALSKSPAGPSSSQTIPSPRLDEPEESEFKPLVSLEDLEIECPVKSRRKVIYYTGPRLRLPDGPLDLTLLARYLLLTGALIVAIIILIELFLDNARGAEPVTADTEDRASVSVRSPSSRSLIPGAALLAQEHIKNVEAVDDAELGMEAVYKLEVADFPALVSMPDRGRFARCPRREMSGSQPSRTSR